MIARFRFVAIIGGSIMFWYGCTKSIEVELRESEPKVKLFSIFEPGQPIIARLSYTSGITDSMLERPVIDASIILFHQKKVVDTLKPAGSGEYLSEFVNYLPSDSLSVEIQVDGRKISAVTEIPIFKNEVKVKVDTLPRLRPGNDVALEFTVTFQDTATSSNFYEVELWMRPLYELKPVGFTLNRVRSDDPVITQQAYTQPLSFITGATPITLPFSDYSFNGQVKTIKFNYSPPWGESTMNDTKVRYMMKHEIIIMFKSISRSYYDFKSSVIRHLLARESDEIFGSSTLVTVIGNISGGVGVFACQTSVSTTLTINQQLIN